MRQYCIVGILIAATLLAACAPNQTSASPPPTARDDLPIFPDAEGMKDDTTSIYYYIISGEDVFDVQRFYKKEMPNSGWEFLGAADTSVRDIGEAYVLWFAKGEEIVTIEIYPRDNMINVFIHFE